MILRIIYEPRGRALEYASLAVSLYRGCSHGCVYCFAPASTRTEREKFLHVQPRKDALKKLEADCKDLAAMGDQREILMSFTCDPYPQTERELCLTRDAIEILVKYGRKFTILTKAGTWVTMDKDLYQGGSDLGRFGTTLTFWNNNDRQIWEPSAATTQDRMYNLWFMKDHGIRTWVSLEPVIYPEQTLELIRQTVGYVDEYRIGKFNHTEGNKDLQEFIEKIGYHYPTDEEWREFVAKAYTLLKFYGKKFIFKRDLQPYLPGGNRT